MSKPTRQSRVGQTRELVRRWTLAAMLIVLVAQQSPVVIAQTAVFRIDPARSSVTIHVGKAGAFSFMAGHVHEVGGPIQTGSVDVDLDTPSRSRVRLSIASSELKVSAAGEPEGDAPKVQETMQGEKVLDVHRYPTITYDSTSVTLKSRSGSLLELSVTGQLAIRDVTQPVTVPVRVELGDSGLSAKGRFEIKQSAFGIKPSSVGVVVSIKDTLGIDFSIVGTK
jgi:polyisoprenoid-binding protein YceI